VTPLADAERWVRDLATALDTGGLAPLVDPDGWWRDLLVGTWDFRTVQGAGRIAREIGPTLACARNLSVAMRTPPSITEDARGRLLSVFFDFETDVGRARGFARLTPSDDPGRPWRAWTVLTQLESITGFEEGTGRNRPMGARHGEWVDRVYWADQQRTSGDGADVLIVGAGQAGLMLAARLDQLGVGTLVVDAHARVGDGWRHRYPSLHLHDIIGMNHFAYLDLPKTWPVCLSRDQFADFVEAYATLMGLSVWTSTRVERSTYADGVWTTDLVRDGVRHTVRSRHVVLATGRSGAPLKPAFAGQESFRGEILHSAEYAGGRPYAGKRVTVVGAGNSAHDVVQDLYEQGATVTLVQRSSTYIVRHATLRKHTLGLYEHDGPPLDDADMMAASTPMGLIPVLQKTVTAAMAEDDRELLDALTAQGFALDYGPDDAGMAWKSLNNLHGYYIDVGASQIIADGKVDVRHGAGVAAYTPDGLVLENGDEIAADAVVLATGYDSFESSVEALMGADVLDRCHAPIHGVGADGEPGTLWRESGHPGLWFAGGGIPVARVYSKFLALRLKAETAGLVPTGKG
jgi:putative flavoprotein involved in K+ transport